VQSLTDVLEAERVRCAEQVRGKEEVCEKRVEEV
jgi:hypothetical protein